LTKINAALIASDKFTFEVWVAPAGIGVQSLERRIVGVTANRSFGNTCFSLAQHANGTSAPGLAVGGVRE